MPTTTRPEVGRCAMMPRLRLAHSPYPSPGWPATPPTTGREVPLYRGREPYRRISVLSDADLLDGVDPTAWGREQLLAGLLSIELVRCVRYADGGPPQEAPREELSVGEVVPGWVVVRDGMAVTVEGRASSLSSLEGNYQDVAEADTRTVAYRHLDSEAAAARRRADGLATLVAEAIGADIFITAREYLHASHWGVADGVTILDIPESLAALGLYLRRQGRYVLRRFPDSADSIVTGRTTFYRLGSWAVLPSAWRWLRSTAQYADGSGDGRPLALVNTIVRRMARALSVRDEVHLALNMPPDGNSSEEALSAFDEALVLLMAALDVSALVSHAVLGTSTKARNAKWQLSSWLDDVRPLAPDLAAVFSSGTRARWCLTLLRLLRNLVHDEALTAVSVGSVLRVERAVVKVPSALQANLSGAFTALGGFQQWGVEELIRGELHFDPGALLEQLMSEVTVLLNAVMDKTPVERLAAVQLQQEDSKPPHQPNGLFDERHLESVRWQLGL